MTALLEAALSYASFGIPVFPCKKDKSPYVSGGFKVATTETDILKQWWGRWPDALIGIPTGQPSGVVVLDIDKKNGKDGFQAIPGWDASSPVIVQTRSGGAHLYFADDGQIRNSADAIGIDVRGTGGYVIAPPSPGYDFLKGGPELFASLPPFPAQFKAKREAEPHHANPKLLADLKRLEAALAGIPNNNLVAWDQWNRVGMATFGATDGSNEGFLLFDAWSQKSEKYNASQTQKIWHGYITSPPDRIGAGTLFYLEALTAQPDAPEPLTFFMHGERPPEPPAWLIRNRLPETGAGLLVGQYSMFKSFMALDLCVHVMLGERWTGQPVKRQGGVLYLAPEGSSGLPLRLAAVMERKMAQAVGNPVAVDHRSLPFVWTNSCPPLLEKGSLAKLIATAAEAHRRFMEVHNLPLALIVIDTMSQSAGWRDENDNAEAAKALSILRELSQRSDALVVGVDHLGKSQEQGTRGASAKEANSDFILAIYGNRSVSGGVTDTKLALRKLRDGPQGDELPFLADQVEMGVDEDGERLTSRIINWDAPASPAPPIRQSRSNAIFGHALSNALRSNAASITVAGNNIQAVERGNVREVFCPVYMAEVGVDKSAAQEAFRRALRWALNAGEVRKHESEGLEWLWPVTQVL